MHSSKSYHFNTDKTAAIAYRTRLGFAVVSGDPIGDVTQFGALVADFVGMCHSRVGRSSYWQAPAALGTVAQRDGRAADAGGAIGRDVVVDVRHFTLAGRRNRNLRQAVQRSHNCGVTTEVVDERDLDSVLMSELTEVLYAAHRAARTERGFCMNLDSVLQGRFPGIKLAIARDRCGQLVAFHRYATAGEGSDITLDMGFRRPDARTA